LVSAGSSSAARMAMMAITTKSSINVNAARPARAAGACAVGHLTTLGLDMRFAALNLVMMPELKRERLSRNKRLGYMFVT
jgi:hypothetical protein